MENNINIKRGKLIFDAPATTIGNYAFYNCSSLTSITIPNSVTSIGNYAFRDCPFLTSLTIPESVTSIGNDAFEGCSSLTSIVWNAKHCADCTSSTLENQITTLVFGDSVQHIPAHLGYGKNNLTSITIPESVTSIGWGAFYKCPSLTSMVVEPGNTTYDSRENCNAIIETATNRLIYGCQNTSIPNSVTSIGNYAFFGCSLLSSVTIPDSVTSIGERAFEDCKGLTKTNYTGDIAGWCNIKLNGTMSNPISYSHNFYINDQEIKDLVIPDSVTSIGNYAFYKCTSLTSVSISDSVTSIGDGAFSDCQGLDSITIGSGVTNIGHQTFYNCGSIISITCKATTPPTLGPYNSFDVTSVYVPAESVEVYKTDINWREYSTVIQPIPES